MKYKKCWIILLLLLLFSINQLSVLAMKTGFETESLSSNDTATFLSNVSIAVLKTEPEKSIIDCFDVNEDGKIAIGISNNENKKISIYTKEGTFLYGYAFRTAGDYGVQWDDNQLIVYFMRSDVAISLDQNGKTIELAKIKNTFENNCYWQDTILAEKKTVGDVRYELKNEIGFLSQFVSSHSQLIAIDSSGEQTVLYDVSEFHFFSTLVSFLFVGLFVGIVSFFVIKNTINSIRASNMSVNNGDNHTN